MKQFPRLSAQIGFIHKTRKSEEKSVSSHFGKFKWLSSDWEIYLSRDYLLSKVPTPVFRLKEEEI